MSELTLKISVDTTGLDKVEAQLKRINNLLVSTGMKKSERVGFTADKFFVANGQVFIDAPFITSATISIAKVTREDKLQEENVMASCKIKETAAGVLANTQETAELIEKPQSEYEETKKQLDKRFNEIQTQITSLQCASASGVDTLSARISNLDVRTDNIESAIATSVRTLREEIAQVKANLR